MASAMAIENLLAGQGELDRAPGPPGEIGRTDIVGKRVELSSESAAERGDDDAYALFRHREDLRDDPPEMKGSLAGAPQGELVVLPDREGGMFLERKVRIALIKKKVRALQGSLLRRALAEFIGDRFVQAALRPRRLLGRLLDS